MSVVIFYVICQFLDFVFVFFFFKQKTAYEMRISDWSSDVCSSDLDLWLARGVARERLVLGVPFYGYGFGGEKANWSYRELAAAHGLNATKADVIGERCAGRSEEHTSELQSLMRISYAVFCLKKKTHSSSSIINQNYNIIQTHSDHLS